MACAYETLRVLGRGSYGTAVLARERSQTGDHLLVLKQVDISEMSQAACDEACKEVEVLRSLQHVNIVAYYRTFIECGRLSIVMEYADGGSLSESIKRRQSNKAERFTEAEALSLFSECCLALQHIHAKHILHRDLKSQNIFLTKDGTVKLGDFGIAKMLEYTDAKAITVIGTPSYLAPEVCDSQPYGTKADIWSLGVVLYEVLTLELPFTAKSLAALVVKIVTGKLVPVSPGLCSAATCRLVKNLLRKEPEKRFNIDEILALPIISRTTRLLHPKAFVSDSEASTRASSRATSKEPVSQDRHEWLPADFSEGPVHAALPLWNESRAHSKLPCHDDFEKKPRWPMAVQRSGEEANEAQIWGCTYGLVDGAVANNATNEPECTLAPKIVIRKADRILPDLRGGGCIARLPAHKRGIIDCHALEKTVYPPQNTGVKPAPQVHLHEVSFQPRVAQAAFGHEAKTRVPPRLCPLLLPPHELQEELLYPGVGHVGSCPCAAHHKRKETRRPPRRLSSLLSPRHEEMQSADKRPSSTPHIHPSSLGPLSRPPSARPATVDVTSGGRPEWMLP